MNHNMLVGSRLDQREAPVECRSTLNTVEAWEKPGFEKSLQPAPTKAILPRPSCPTTPDIG